MPELRQMKLPLLLVLLNLVISLGFWAFGRLPAEVPLSWWQGEPLVMGERWVLLLRGPAFMLAILAAIVVGLRWDRTLTGRRRAGALGPVFVLMMGMATYGHLRLLSLAASGASHPMPGIGDFVVAGLCFAGLGNYVAKTESNGFYAFGFPWLKGNERAYLKTQRLAAWLWVGTGCGLMLGSPLLVALPMGYMMALTPAAILGIILVVTLASWLYSRGDAPGMGQPI